MTPVRANGMLWAAEVWREAMNGLREGRTVTPFVLEPQTANSKAPLFHFEVVVKRADGVALPRVTAAMVRKHKAGQP